MHRYIISGVLLAIPDAARRGGAGVHPDAPDPGRHLRRPPGRRRRHVRSARRRAVPRRARHRRADDRAVPPFRLGILSTFDFGISMWSGKPVIDGDRHAPAGVAGGRVAGHGRSPSLIAIPLGTISALKQNTWIDVVVRTVRDRRHRHAVVLARHHVASCWCSMSANAITGTPWMPPIDYVPFWKDPMRNLSMASCRRSPSATATPRSACA